MSPGRIYGVSSLPKTWSSVEMKMKKSGWWQSLLINLPRNERSKNGKGSIRWIRKWMGKIPTNNPTFINFEFLNLHLITACFDSYIKQREKENIQAPSGRCSLVDHTQCLAKIVFFENLNRLETRLHNTRNSHLKHTWRLILIPPIL